MEQNFYSFQVEDASGKTIELSAFKGKVVLVVNVASKCGYTPQYAGLEKLYQKFKDRNFMILGFPCNQFGKQESGSNEQIQEFCSLTYNVTFPVYAKIEVNGESSAPVYKWMKSVSPGILGTEAIKWNFTKFLVDPTGKVYKRYAPQVEPEDMTSDIEQLLLNSL